MQNFHVSVAPSMEIYHVLQNLSYSSASAFGEFIDNSIQSYLDNERAIAKVDGDNAKLSVRIAIDSKKKSISIEDNANGISRDRFKEAMRAGIENPNSEPHASDSLSVYGIGMKTAAIWLSDTWKIETSTVGKKESLSTNFNLNELVETKTENVLVISNDEDAHRHYTRITLTQTSHIESKEHYQNDILPVLVETYAKFPFLGIEITYDGETLSNSKIFKDTPKPLVYPVVNNQGGPAESKDNVTWRRNINLTCDFGNGKHIIKGFVMILEKGSYGQPGLRLFRNNRLVLGTSLQPNTPRMILGTSNKFANQRLYGELHLDTVPIDFMKTGFTVNLNILYKKIRSSMGNGKHNFITQAQNFRSRSRKPTDPQPKKAKPRGRGRQKSRDRIQASEEFSNLLQQLGNKKATGLYESICGISLKRDPILAYVAVGVFLETLSQSVGNKPEGNKKPQSFADFYSNKLNHYEVHKTERTRIRRVITGIQDKYNDNKHAARWYTTSATQLEVDMEAITPFLCDCIKK